MKDDISFIDNLLRQVPELRSCYDEHLADNDELLAHVLMGDVTRFALAQVDDHRGKAVLTRLLEYLEGELKSGSEEVKEMIVVSFLENLLGETRAVMLEPLMGENLKKWFDELRRP